MSWYKSISGKLEKYLNSTGFHTIINILTVIDCICIIIILILEYVELSIIHNDFLEFQKTLRDENFKDINLLQKTLNVTLEQVKRTETTRPNFRLAHIILTVIILTILSLFIIEILTKLIFTPRIFIKRKFEILEAIVIIVSFGFDFTLLIGRDEILSIIGLATLIRLWRIGLILEEITARKHAEAQKEIHNLKLLKNEMHKQLTDLKQKLNQHSEEALI
ncbi:unnamed protein product [Brachionus calyciflorus]|uniref:Hydrogen voltage-gated channel 1 n=1 Tax=Brachionus calyciflorus TaxID=104777 RepID=A0A813S3L3_9BILA|nr:unnamed protein product [Brachionus calyciflorus]